MIKHACMVGVETPERCGACGHVWPCPEEQTARRIADLEHQLADERARIDCSTRSGWLSEDLECAEEDGPACWKHLLAEARGKLDAVQLLCIETERSQGATTTVRKVLAILHPKEGNE